jgi:rod shape-determining protein MreC
MRNLIKLIIRYHFFLLFIAIEIVALTFVFSENDYQQASIVNLGRDITGRLNHQISSWTEYLDLKSINDNLALENTSLKVALLKWELFKDDGTITPDSLFKEKYFYKSARVVSQSVNRQRNFLMLNVGSKEGVEPEMAVISSEGVVGIVKGVSENFSTVISIINIDIRISSRLKSNDYFGSIYWDGVDYRYAILSEIPHHAEVLLGDTVVTSGFSAIFPYGLPIGTVEDFQIKGANFYDIKVKLFTDFKKLSHVYVLGSLLQEERTELESQLIYD